MSALEAEKSRVENEFNQLETEHNRSMGSMGMYGSEEAKRVEELEKIVEKKKLELKE